jgi:hypothetical protein
MRKETLELQRQATKEFDRRYERDDDFARRAMTNTLTEEESRKYFPSLYPETGAA